jgi:RNA polymerase sigma-70 factor (ECF subfamily)
MVGLQAWREWRGTTCQAGPNEPAEGQETEGQLLRAGREGDQEALARLLEPHERALYALCRGILGHPDDADDAVQETFFRALRALPRFRGDAAVRTWLFRIAVRVCLDWKRASPPTTPWDDEQAPAARAALSPEAIVLRHLSVLEALRTLLPRQRAVLLLKEVEGWSVAEIGAALRWNEKRVHNELYRARRALADWRRQEAAEGDER